MTTTDNVQSFLYFQVSNERLPALKLTVMLKVASGSFSPSFVVFHDKLPWVKLAYQFNLNSYRRKRIMLRSALMLLLSLLSIVGYLCILEANY